MGFGEAVRTVLTKSTVFSGRAGLAEYWFWVLAVVILNMAYSTIDWMLGSGFIGWLWSLAFGILSLVLLIPGLAVAVRRLHDTNKTGWLLLVGLVPIFGWIALLVFMLLPSDPGPNLYGYGPEPAVR